MTKQTYTIVDINNFNVTKEKLVEQEVITYTNQCVDYINREVDEEEKLPHTHDFQIARNYLKEVFGFTVIEAYEPNYIDLTVLDNQINLGKVIKVHCAKRTFLVEPLARIGYQVQMQVVDKETDKVYYTKVSMTIAPTLIEVIKKLVQKFSPISEKMSIMSIVFNR